MRDIWVKGVEEEGLKELYKCTTNPDTFSIFDNNSKVIITPFSFNSHSMCNDTWKLLSKSYTGTLQGHDFPFCSLFVQNYHSEFFNSSRVAVLNKISIIGAFWYSVPTFSKKFFLTSREIF
jgi:hypothetical protein